MSDTEEESKPKINLNIVHNQQTLTVKVKVTMKLEKVFRAAEKRFEKEKGTFKFTYEGQRLTEDQTPASVGMEDGDQIDAFLEQLGGGDRFAQS